MAEPRSVLQRELATQASLQEQQRLARTTPVADARVLNMPFSGNRVLEAANSGRANLVPPDYSYDNLPDEDGGEQSKQARLQQAQRQARQAQEMQVQEEQSQQEEEDLAQQEAAGAQARQDAGLAQLAKAAGDQQSKSLIQRSLDRLSERSQVMFGGMLKALWSGLWMSFGHTIYIIDIMFAVGFVLNVIFGRRVVPEVGGEWIPPVPIAGGSVMGGAGKDLKRLRRQLILMIKIGEFMALGVITGLVMLMDAAILFIIAGLVEAANGISSIF